MRLVERLFENARGIVGLHALQHHQRTAGQATPTSGS